MTQEACPNCQKPVDLESEATVTEFKLGVGLVRNFCCLDCVRASLSKVDEK